MTWWRHGVQLELDLNVDAPGQESVPAGRPITGDLARCSLTKA
jgi:hypothetical protein